MATPASSHRFFTPTAPDRVHEISPAPPRPLAATRACQGPPLQFSTCVSDAPVDHSSEGLAVASSVDASLALSEHGPYLVGGTIALDDASGTSKIAIHSGAGVLAPFCLCNASWHWLPTDFYSTKCFESHALRWCGIHRVRAERRPSVLGGLWRIGPSEKSTSVRLSVQFVREYGATCPLAVWACVVPPSVMQHVVLLGRESWMRFNSRSNRSLSPRPSDQRVFGELDLVHHAPTGMSVYAIDPPLWVEASVYASRAL